MNFFDLSEHLSKIPHQTALCTVVAISGSTPRKAGAKMLVADDKTPFGTIYGTIGGGAIEHHVRALALDAIKAGQSRLVTTSLRNELGMCCGGEMTVFIEPITKPARVICFGAGHIAQSLCLMAQNLDFSIIVIDQRKDLLEHQAFAQCERHFDHSIFTIKALTITSDDFIIIATHDHQLDQQIIEHVLAFPARYIGLVGSKRKALMTQKRLIAKNFSGSQRAHFHCPAGLDIKAETPQEIALSILAHIILVKNDHSNSRTDYSSGPQQTHGFSQSPLTL